MNEKQKAKQGNSEERQTQVRIMGREPILDRDRMLKINSFVILKSIMSSYQLLRELIIHHTMYYRKVLSYSGLHDVRF